MPGIESLTFGAPWLLLGLVALPAIYWLLRITPPPVRRLKFPPFRLLSGLQSREEQPARMPLWMLLLRLLATAVVIVALAEPTLDAAARRTATGPLVLFVDNGWTAAENWSARRAEVEQALNGAMRDDRSVVLVATASAHRGGPVILDPARALRLAQDLRPEPWLPNRLAAVAALEDAAVAGAQIVWLSDGMDHGNAAAVAQRLRAMGSLEILADAPGAGALALLPPEDGTHGFIVRVARAGTGVERAGEVRAIGPRGAVLGSASFKLGADARFAAAEIALPLEVRNGTARLAISNAESAGAVQLLDARFRRRPAGIVYGGSSERAQPLLSDSYYLERALAPYAEIRKGTVAELIDSGIAVLVLADVGRIAGADLERVGSFVAEGGVLLRFAGGRMATGTDDLVPVKLRTGGRYLGSALAWPEPQGLAAFPEEGPFSGLAVPGDVRISRQLLAEPSVELSERTWARLSDGTPLVTGAPRGKGWVVLFHVTANPNWSSLPMSGLFVEMIRRVLTLAEGIRPGEAGGELRGTYPPFETLDGYGHARRPPAEAIPLKGEELEATRAGPTHPPGLYGAEGAFLALNAVARDMTFAPLPDLGQTIGEYANVTAKALKFPLLAIAFALLVVDALVSLVLRGHLHVPRSVLRAGAAAGGTLLLAFAAPHDVRADDSFAMAAALDTRLAYVITGVREVDEMSRAGLYGLGLALRDRTAYEPAEPMGVDIDKDELSFFPLLYWPMDPGQRDLSPEAVRKVSDYMRLGGTILFDTRDIAPSIAGGPPTPGEETLRRLLARLDLPPLEPVPEDHVLAKAFYLLHDYPGRWAGGRVWVEALPPAVAGDDAPPARGGDGVSPIIIGSADWAAAWARDENGRPLAAVVPGGERQREMAIRFGINVVMYAMTGNYKTDQVHVPALLERLGQ